MADGVITSYSKGQILIEIPKLLVVIEGRKFPISFNIILIGSKDIILG